MQCAQVLAFVTLAAKCYYARPVTDTGSQMDFRPLNNDEDVHVTAADHVGRTAADGWSRRCGKNDSTLPTDTFRRRRYGGRFVISHSLQWGVTVTAGVTPTVLFK